MNTLNAESARINNRDITRAEAEEMRRLAAILTDVNHHTAKKQLVAEYLGTPEQIERARYLLQWLRERELAGHHYGYSSQNADSREQTEMYDKLGDELAILEKEVKARFALEEPEYFEVNDALHDRLFSDDFYSSPSVRAWMLENITH